MIECKAYYPGISLLEVHYPQEFLKLNLKNYDGFVLCYFVLLQVVVFDAS